MQSEEKRKSDEGKINRASEKCRTSLKLAIMHIASASNTCIPVADSF